MPRHTTVELGADRSPGQMSKVVGLYQMLLRRALEHFFPDARLETLGDRSFIALEPTPGRPEFCLTDDPDGPGLELEWFRTLYRFTPGSPRPFQEAERRLIESAVRVLDRRFRALFDPEAAHREEMFHYAVEDFIVADDLDSPDAVRVPAALEALRVAALSTYENRRVSTGVLLLGTEHDPADPERVNPPGPPVTTSDWRRSRPSTGCAMV